MDIAVLGAGNRARKYLSCLPDGVKVGCLVEPEEIRLGQAAARFGVPSSGCYRSAEAFFAAPHPGIEAAIVAAPDRQHVPLALQCVRRGWHVLLEKPAAVSEEEYRQLQTAAERAGVQVGVCLEMRFHPYFRRIRELAASIGEISRIDHVEHIGPDRMAHTFVRGLWSKAGESGPIFLSKCCHDADFLLWLAGAQTVGEVRSSGSLSLFRSSSAPEGAALRCIGCPIERTCRYSAVDLYQRRVEWVSGFDVPEGLSLSDVINKELREGRYGRCVYHCDNDVYDTQTVTAVLDGKVRLTMKLEGTSLEEGRCIRITGSGGVLEAQGGKIVLRSEGNAAVAEDFSDIIKAPLHAGADAELVRDFFESIADGKEPLTSLPSVSSGHLLCYKAIRD